MARPVLQKASLWLDSDKGLRGRFSDELKEPAGKRDDVPNVLLETKAQRGDRVQELRLKFYPSINVDYNKLFAGKAEATLEEVEDALLEMGYRNNPTAYVEVTEQFGPDDGSYARQFITETGSRRNIPVIGGTVSPLKRVKRQIHVTLYKVENEVHFLSHEEISAWLQPTRHVVVGDSSARVGVRDFRDDWFDAFNSELPGGESVKWETNN